MTQIDIQIWLLQQELMRPQTGKKYDQDFFKKVEQTADEILQIIDEVLR